MKRIVITTLMGICLAGFIYSGVSNIVHSNEKLKSKDIELRSKSSDLQLLELKFNKLNVDLREELDSNTHDQKKIEELESQKQDLQKQLDKAQSDLQAKAKQKADEEQKLARAASTALGTQKAYAASGNYYKDFIYQHESGNSTTAVNSIGCRGLGQACPGTKLPCGDDYSCQDAWFTNYAMQRYGSWENAYNFWVANHWW